MCAGKVRQVKKNISLPPGYWQMFSYGRLTELPTAKRAIWIHAYFRRVLLDHQGLITHWSGEVQRREVPVGELVAWEPGCVFDAATHKVKGPQPIAPGATTTTVQVGFADENCKLISRYWRDPDGQYVLPNRRLLPEDPEADTYFLRVGRGLDTPLLIPCTTVLQSFWGRSSNLVHMLLDSRFLDFNAYVVNTEKCSMVENGEALVWLRQWSLDVDARFLASLTFDAGAIQRGKDIALRLQAEMRETAIGQRARAVCALPPHDQVVDLRVVGFEVKTAAGPFFFVQRVLHSSYKPMFTSLKYDRDNDGRKAETASRDRNGATVKPKKPIKRQPTSRPRDVSSSEFHLAQDHPGTNTLQETADIGQFDPHFPGIASIPATKLPQLEVEFENEEQEAAAYDARWNELSTLPGCGGPRQKAAGVVLSSGRVLNDPLDESSEEAGPPLGRLMHQVMELEPFEGQELLPDGVDHLEIEPVFPWRASPAYGGKWLFSLPDEVDDYAWAWLYSDPGQEVRKRGLCLKVNFWGAGQMWLGEGLIVEIEGRFTRKRSESTSESSKNSPILFVWHGVAAGTSEGVVGAVTTPQLRDVILRLISEGGNAVVTKSSLGMRCQARRHSSAALKLKQLIGELYGWIQGGQ
jgi:hypothetical protein